MTVSLKKIIDKRSLSLFHGLAVFLIYPSKGGMAKSNAGQVEKIVRIAKACGLEPATPDEAREILDLKGLERVKY